MIDLLKSLVRRFEGLFLKPYRCPAGVWTVGYGHTNGVTQKSPPITEPIAEQFLDEDCDVAACQALQLSPGLHGDDKRCAAVADFVLNLGSSRYKASTFRRKVNAEEWDDAADECEKWIWGGGRKLPGLVLRRHVEAQMLRGVI